MDYHYHRSGSHAVRQHGEKNEGSCDEVMKQKFIELAVRTTKDEALGHTVQKFTKLDHVEPF